LLQQIGLAYLDLFRGRCSVTGWPAFNYIADKNMLVPVKTAGTQNFIEQLSGSSDKRTAFQILVPARCFTDYKNWSMRVAFPKNHMVSGFCQTAPVTAQYFPL
jgi:hypothetical protein